MNVSRSRGVKQENSADEPCLKCFYMLFSAQDGLRELREPGRIPRKTINEKNKLLDSQKSSNPLWRS